jgi:hypothetical protein
MLLCSSSSCPISYATHYHSQNRFVSTFFYLSSILSSFVSFSSVVFYFSLSFFLMFVLSVVLCFSFASFYILFLPPFVSFLVSVLLRSFVSLFGSLHPHFLFSRSFFPICLLVFVFFFLSILHPFQPFNFFFLRPSYFSYFLPPFLCLILLHFHQMLSTTFPARRSTTSMRQIIRN